MSLCKIGRMGAIGLVVTAWGWAGVASAQAPTSSVGQVAATVRAAKSQFRPVTRADVQAVLADLTAAVNKLDARLQAAPDKQEAWRKYLQWDKLQAELQKPNGPDAAALIPVYERFAAGYEGLELKWFACVRKALRQYIEIAGAVDNPGLKAAFEQKLDQLAGQLEAWAAQPTPSQAQDIIDLLSWVETARQTPEVVQSVRSQFAQPNFHAQIAGDVVAAGIAAPVDETEPITDCILGTSIHGIGRTVGKTTVCLTADPYCGAFDTVLKAVNHSRNVGHNGPVCIYSTGRTDISACKRFWIDACGLHGEPATAEAQTDTDICDIEAINGRKIIERFAWRRAGKQKAEAEAIAASHAEQRVSQRVDAQAAPSIEKANEDYAKKVRVPLADRLAFPNRLDFATTPEAILVTGLEAAADQLAAPLPAPPIKVRADLAIRVHESMINNMASTVLAGMVLREDMLHSAIVSFLGRMPEGLKDEKDDEPWTILFAYREPITVAFSDNGFGFTMRGREFIKGDKKYPGMNVGVSYKFEKTPTGIKAVRVGDLQIFPPGFVPGAGKQLSLRQQAIRTLLQKRLGKIFEPEMIPKGFTLSGKWACAGKFEPADMAGQNGWLTIAWQRAVPAATRTAMAE